MFNVLQNETAVPVACWSCSIGHSESTLFCPHCSKIQPPPGGDYYSVFGLHPRLNLDLAALEREFHKLSRKLHPDRYARALDNEKEWSLADTALVNDAYRTLKDPLRRTEYLLKLVGQNVNEPGNGKKGSGAPPDLLEEVFDLNMQLEEMRMIRQMGEEDAQLTTDLSSARRKYTAMLTEVDGDIRNSWTAWDNGNDTLREAEQRKMVALLDRRRYLHNLVRDVNDVLAARYESN